MPDIFTTEPGGGDAVLAEGAPRRDRIAEIIMHSEPVVQILAVPPHWLARSGSVLIFGVVSLLLCLAWIIRYPDIVPASVVISTKLPPATVVAQGDGHLEMLAVHDGDRVAAGALLARLATSANPEAVSRLEAFLAGWDDDNIPSVAAVGEMAKLRLGELNADTAALIRAHAALAWYNATDPTGPQLRALAAQRQPLQDRIDSLERQRNLLASEKAIADRSYQRVTQLAQNKDASVLTLEDRLRAVIGAQRSLEALAVDGANTRLDLARVEGSIADLVARDRQQRQDLAAALREAVRTLRGKLALWQRTYVLRAPIAGTVSLTKFSTDSQFVRAGEEVMAIVPAEQQPLIGRILLPISRAGSVHEGQEVFVQVDNYPAEQFGKLRGRVTAISPVPASGHYAVTMTLTDGLMTTFARQLGFQQEMQGRAEIVVEDLRIIDRIFARFRRTFARGGE